MVDTELVVKISGSGAGQTVRDVLGVQKAIAQLGKDSKDAANLARALGTAFNLSDDQVQDLAQALSQAKAEAKQLEQQGRSLNGVFQGVFQGIGQQLTQVGFQALNATLATVGGTIKSAIGEFERFELALVSFDAKSTASQEQIKRIGEQAKELAAVTSQSPAGVAELATALLTLGATADEVEDNLRGITFLADVLGEDPVLTGQVVQTGINIFGEFGETADSLSDKLNFLINNSAAGAQGGLSEFFQLFADVGGIVGATGASFDELAATFAVLRNGGASASIAATGIKTALLALSAPTSAANAELKKLGISAFDADGNFRGFEQVLLDASDALKTASQQEQIQFAEKVFGREGAPAFLTALKSANGGLSELIQGLKTEADGSLAESLETINGALIRQVEILEGSIGEGLTAFGEALAPVKLAAVQFANDIFDSATEASEGFDGLTEAGTRLGTVLQGNPALAEALGQAFADLFDTAIDQLAQVIDAITAFVSTEGNIEIIANQLSLVGDAIVLVGQGARFLIALADGIGQIVTAAGDLPIVGDNFERFLRFPTPLNALTEALRAMGEVFGVLVGAIADGASTAVEAVGRVFPVVQPLVDRVLQLLDLIGREPTEATAFEGIGIGATGAGEAIKTLEATMGSVGEATQKLATDTEDAGNRTAAAVETVEEALKRLGDTNKANLDDLSTDAANARAALLEAGGDPAKLAELEAKTLRDRIQNNRDFLKELEALQSRGGLSAEDAAAVADQIRQVDGQLASDRVSLAQATLAEQKWVEEELAKAAEEAAKKQTDALKEQRDEEKRLAEERQGLQEDAARRGFDDAREDRADDRAEARRKEDRKLRDDLQAADEAHNKRQRDEDKAAQEARQAAEDAFRKQQEAKAEAFQARQQAERDKANRDFDALGSEVDRRFQLETADPAQRRELEKQFEEERKNLELRRQIEREVLAQRGAVLAQEDLSLSPLEQARADFEARLQEEAKAFQLSQQEEEAAFRAKLDDEEEARQIAREQAEEERRKARQREDDEREDKRREEDEKFEDDERRLQENFEAELRRQREAFNAEQRRLDEESAGRIAAILAAARPAPPNGQSLRVGGVAEGGVVQVHKDEFLLPPKGTRVVSQRESRALVRESLSVGQARSLMTGVSFKGAAGVSPAVVSTSKLESQMAELLKEVKRGRKVQPGGNTYNLNTTEPVKDAIALQMEEIRALVRSGRL